MKSLTPLGMNIVLIIIIFKNLEVAATTPVNYYGRAAGLLFFTEV